MPNPPPKPKPKPTTKRERERQRARVARERTKTDKLMNEVMTQAFSPRTIKARAESRSKARGAAYTRPRVDVYKLRQALLAPGPVNVSAAALKAGVSRATAVRLIGSDPELAQMLAERRSQGGQGYAQATRGTHRTRRAAVTRANQGREDALESIVRETLAECRAASDARSSEAKARAAALRVTMWERLNAMLHQKPIWKQGQSYPVGYEDDLDAEYIRAEIAATDEGPGRPKALITPNNAPTKVARAPAIPADPPPVLVDPVTGRRKINLRKPVGR